MGQQEVLNVFFGDPIGSTDLGCRELSLTDQPINGIGVELQVFGDLLRGHNLTHDCSPFRSAFNHGMPSLSSVQSLLVDWSRVERASPANIALQFGDVDR